MNEIRNKDKSLSNNRPRAGKIYDAGILHHVIIFLTWLWRLSALELVLKSPSMQN